MKMPQYVTVEEVRRICKELKIRDWTKLTDPKISPAEGRIILRHLAIKGMKINVEDFCQGLEVELEHGTRFPDANVTNNHPILTGKIVIAHFKETLDYYKRLDVAEIEGDLLKAVVSKKTAKVEALYKKLIKARAQLSKIESAQTAKLK